LVNLWRSEFDSIDTLKSGHAIFSNGVYRLVLLYIKNWQEHERHLEVYVGRRREEV
jgi:hypothetical protein